VVTGLESGDDIHGAADRLIDAAPSHLRSAAALPPSRRSPRAFARSIKLNRSPRHARNHARNSGESIHAPLIRNL
jgi:hypothetical protein